MRPGLEHGYAPTKAQRQRSPWLTAGALQAGERGHIRSGAQAHSGMVQAWSRVQVMEQTWEGGDVCRQDGPLTSHFRVSLNHKEDSQTKFIKPNSQRQDIIIKYWVSIGSIHKEQG